MLFNILRPGQNGCQFADNNFKCIFSNKNIQISTEISQFFSKVVIDDKSELVRWLGAGLGTKPLAEPILTYGYNIDTLTEPLLTKLCDASQRVNHWCHYTQG